ncbi:preprotein translocase subunit YajC [Arachidicoccus ginsenosidimutans]|uniref:preprotein translocase subunit YajC n=1 Tax=Arachidicoccus sp. BS20 TaxID=1850526 RepID=UPI0007F0DD90|nr:preprotein translocase subunit YajC [Arachidicoccus sp. BS20]ANI88816.1 preprotein translocase subunit YajC [Arachidicoccus sp. BS20]
MTTNAVLMMAAQGNAQSSWITMLPMLGIIVVFYFFLMRPQQKKAKDQKNFINNLQKGDKIVTIAGVHGTVNKINEDGTTIQLETSPGSYVKLEKSAISLEWTTALQKANGGTATK